MWYVFSPIEQLRIPACLILPVATLLLTSCDGSAVVDPIERGAAVESGVRITDIAPRDGRLRVQWSPYDGEDFVAYSIYERTGAGSVLRYVSQNASEVKWVDSSYIGGEVTYELRVRTSGGSVADDEQTFTAISAAILEVSATSEHRARLQWSPGDFGENVARFGVSRAFDQEETLLTESLDRTATSFVDPSAMFGLSYGYRLISYNEDGESSSSALYDFHLGEVGTPFRSLAYAPSISSYYLRSESRIDRVDIKTHEIVSTYTIPSDPTRWIRALSITPERNLIYVAHGTSIAQLDPVTLDVVSTIQLRDLLGYDAIALNLSVADDGTAMFYTATYVSPTYYGDALVLADFTSLQLHERRTDDIPFSVVEITSGGDYAVAGGPWLDLWTTSDGTLQRVASNVGMQDYFCFINDGLRYVTTDGGAISIFNTATQQLEASYSTGHDMLWPVIDPDSGLLGGYDRHGGWYRIYDLTSGRPVDRIEAPMRPYTFAGRTLFGGGYYLELNLD